jgi:hypothetical protein
MSAAPPRLIPKVPEPERVRGAKVIGAQLAGMDRTTVTRRAKAGRLVVLIDGQARAVVYQDHKGYWAPKGYLKAWLEQQDQAVGANDTVHAG